MGISKASLLVVTIGLTMAGCQSSRFDSSPSAPAPLPPAPSGRVQSAPLTPANPAEFPSMPDSSTQAGSDLQNGQQMASLPPEGAPDLTVGSVAGVWNASLGGQSCKIATPQTKFGQGYRAGPLRCPGELASLSSWAVKGKQLVLYDGSGASVATLHSSGSSRFDGQTSTGQSLSLSR